MASISQLLKQAVSVRDPAAAGYLLGWALIGALPSPVVHSVARLAADRACHGGKGMEQLRKNLTRVVGAENVTRQLVQASMRSYARYWVEAFRLPKIAADPHLLAQLDQSVAGVEHLDASLASGRGVILTLPHSGNWDMAGVWLVHHAGQFATVAERLKPPVLFDAFVDFRHSLGFEVFAHTSDAGAPSPFESLRKVLSDGGVVALMGERDLKRRGVPVQFFGEATTFPVGAAQLALSHGAALHVVDCHFTSKGWGMSISPEIPVTDLPETAQRIADAFASNIAAHPADWHMLQPLWPADFR